MNGTGPRIDFDGRIDRALGTLASRRLPGDRDALARRVAARVELRSRGRSRARRLFALVAAAVILSGLVGALSSAEGREAIRRLLVRVRIFDERGVESGSGDAPLEIAPDGSSTLRIAPDADSSATIRMQPAAPGSAERHVDVRLDGKSKGRVITVDGVPPDKHR